MSCSTPKISNPLPTTMGGQASKPDSNKDTNHNNQNGRSYPQSYSSHSSNTPIDMNGSPWSNNPFKTKQNSLYTNSSQSDDDDCVCFNPFATCSKGSLSNGKSKKKRHPFGTPLPDSPKTLMGKRIYCDSRDNAFLEKERESAYDLTKLTKRVKQRGMELEDFDDDVGAVHEGPAGERELFSKYEICEVLGVGSTSTVHKCVNRQTGEVCACKIIDSKQIESRFHGMMHQFHNEVMALRFLHHPNIIKLYDVYLTDDKIYIIMELMEGGELFDYVVKKGTLTEEEASRIVRKVTSALVYMHSQNIIHRDLKPENLLLKHKPRCPSDIEIKIIDFGLSKELSEPVARTFLGTRGYLAPEMLQRKNYTSAVDAWALGVIVFVLLCGCLPFDDDSGVLPNEISLKQKFNLRYPRWAKNLSKPAKDLLSHLLDIDPNRRYTAEKALDHPWVKGEDLPRNNYLHSPGRMSINAKHKLNMNAASKSPQPRERVNNPGMVSNHSRHVRHTSDGWHSRYDNEQKHVRHSSDGWHSRYDNEQSLDDSRRSSGSVGSASRRRSSSAGTFNKKEMTEIRNVFHDDESPRKGSSGQDFRIPPHNNAHHYRPPPSHQKKRRHVRKASF